MSNQRTHYMTTSDGVTLGGTVHGEGPPLVFLQGGVGDGDLDWGQVAEHLAGRYTCHLPSLRGRGLSGDHPDLSLARIIDDAVEYVDSIGETVGLTGWSGGGAWALAAAARSGAVSALAPFEPAMLILADEQEQALVGRVVGRMVELLNEGDLPAAARAFAAFPLFDEEISAAADLGYFEASGRYVPNLLAVLQSVTGGEDPTSDPAVLSTVTVPVEVLVGSATKPLFARSAEYVVDHVQHGRVHEIAGAAHGAPLTHPEALAGALNDFFSSALQPA